MYAYYLTYKECGFFLMDPSSSWLIVLYVFLVVASACFSAMEMSFSSVTKIKLLNYKDERPGDVDLAVRILEKYDFYLVTLVIGNNIVNTACAAVSTILTARVFSALSEAGVSTGGSAAAAISTALTTVIVFMFGETIPKSYAKDNAEKFTLSSASLLRFFSYLFRPLVLMFYGLTKLLDRAVPPTAEPTVTEEELSTIIENSEEEGVLDEDQSELLRSALEFSDTRVSDVLTLRDDVVWLDLSATEAEVMRKVQSTNYSRLPVCAGTLDKPVGILIVNDFLKAVIGGKYTGLRRLLRKPYYTTLDASIDDLKDEMSGKRQHIALVRDKTGTSIIGIVTMEDFVEELVGEIYDETDTVDDTFMKLGGNYFEVAGRIPVSEMFRRMGYRPRRPVPGHKLVSTWVLEQLGRIPEEGDSFSFEDLTVDIDETEQNRVSRLTVKMKDPDIDPDEAPQTADDGKGGDGK